MKYKPRKLPMKTTPQSDYVVDAHGFHKAEKHTTALSSENLAQSIWDLWYTLTKRDDDPVNDVAVQSIQSALGEWKTSPLHIVETLVRSAVYIPPHMDDKMDVERLRAVFVSSQSRQTASENMNDILSRAYYYQSVQESRDRIAEILQQFDIESFDDIAENEQSAVMSLIGIDDEEFQGMFAAAKNSFPDKVKPSDVVLIGKGKSLYPATSDDNVYQYGVVRKKTKDTSYDAGRVEESSLFSDSMEVDLDASQMILEGYETKDILAFHRDVPRGYWQDVLQQVDEGNVDLVEVYETLEEKYNWHPADRRKPQLL